MGRRNFRNASGAAAVFFADRKNADDALALVQLLNRSIAQNKFRYFIGHAERLRKPEANVQSERIG